MVRAEVSGEAITRPNPSYRTGAAAPRPYPRAIASDGRGRGSNFYNSARASTELRVEWAPPQNKDRACPAEGALDLYCEPLGLSIHFCPALQLVGMNEHSATLADDADLRSGDPIIERAQAYA